MREILFRAKRLKEYDKDENWVYGVPCMNYKDECEMHTSDSVRLVNPETIGEFTGLYDKNGVKVFEGDVVNYFDKDFLNHEVIYTNGCFMFRFISIFTQRARNTKQEPIFDNISMCGKVIGNIYDNPELLDDTIS